MNRRTALAVSLLAILICAAPACSNKNPPLIPDANMRIGVAPFTQPENTTELMAGYLMDSTPRVEARVFPQLNNDFADLLAEMTSRDYIGLDVSVQCMEKTPKSASSAAFDYWLAVGRCMNVDLLIVPQVHSWVDRREGEPAAVSIDIFLLDVNNKAMLARSRYDERQRALLDNLFDVGKFIERGGRWVSASTLAKEGMFKAIKDFGL